MHRLYINIICISYIYVLLLNPSLDIVVVSQWLLLILVAADRVFGPCGTRFRLSVCSAERLFGAVFGVPGVFGSGFTAVFGSVRQQTMLVVCSAERVFGCSASF